MNRTERSGRPALVLASGNPFRATMLSNAGIEFETVPARVDERAAEQPLVEAGADPGDVAAVLAQVKADEVAARRPGALVIGCDQTLGLDGEILHKPASREEAMQRILLLSGRVHQLNSAVCLMMDGNLLWSHVEVASIRFRDLDPGYVGRHVARAGDMVLKSVGAYQVEGPGIQLIDRIEGDFFSIVGLPLLPLLAELRRMNAIES